MKLSIKPKELNRDGNLLINKDGSSYSSHGQVEISTDPYFGDVLSFEGDGVLEVPLPSPASGQTISISFWAFVDSDTDAYVPVAAINPENAEGLETGLVVQFEDESIDFNSGNEDDFDNVTKEMPDGETNAGKWTHWRFIKDAGTGVAEIWRNGSIWHHQNGNHKEFGRLGSISIGGLIVDGEPDGQFVGKIAQFEISEDIKTAAQNASLLSLSPERINEEATQVVDANNHEFAIDGEAPSLSFDKYFGGCLEFNPMPGKKSFLHLPPEVVPQAQDFAISFWSKPDSISQPNAVVQVKTKQKKVRLDLRLPWTGISGKPELVFETGGNGFIEDVAGSELTPEDLAIDKWTHWAFVRSTPTKKEQKAGTKAVFSVFRNGVTWGSPTLSDKAAVLLKSATMATLGSDTDGKGKGVNGYLGTIAQFSIYGSALTIEQIIQENPALRNLNKVTNGDQELARKLIDQGIFSCLQIASMTQVYFVKKFITVFNGDKKAATHTYLRARDVKSQLTVHFMGLNEQAGHYKYVLPNNQSGATKDKLGHLPSYRQLFDTTEYCEVDEAHSIYSPSAYLVDLCRFKDINIDDVKAPPNFKLFDRRPDLQNIWLKPKTVTTIVPKLKIVDKVFDAQLLKAHKAEFISAPVIDLPLDGAISNIVKGGDEVSLSGSERFKPKNDESGKLAFEFDGATDLETAKLNLGNNFTISARVNVGENQSGTIFEVGASELKLVIEPLKPEMPGHFVDLQLSATQTDKKGAPVTKNVKCDRVVKSSRWAHIAVVCNKGGCHIYINGKSEAQLSTVGQKVNAAVKFGSDLTGLIADIAIFKSALTSDQVIGLNDPHSELYKRLSEQAFPSSLPFHFPLESIRGNLKFLNSSLPEIWQTFNPKNQTLDGAQAREILNISPAEWDWLTGEKSLPGLDKLKGEARNKEFVRLAFGMKKDDKFLEKLSHLEVFAAHTGLSAEQIKSLAYGDLSDAEIIDRVQDQFYINSGTKEKGFIQLDTVKGELFFWANEKAGELTAKQFIRLFHVTRLAKHTNWSFAEADWAIRCALNAIAQKDRDAVSKGNLPKSALVVIAQIKQWTDQFSISIDDGCAIVSGQLRTFGDGESQNYYEKQFGPVQQTPIPEILNWTGKSQHQDDQLTSKINAWFMSGLRISALDLRTMSNEIDLTEHKFTDTNVMIATFHRFTVLSRMTKLSITDAIELTKLSGEFKNILKLTPIDTVSAIRKVLAYASDFASISVDVPSIQYFAQGKGPGTSKIDLSDRDIINFARNTKDALTKVLQKPIKNEVELEVSFVPELVTDRGIVVTPFPNTMEIWLNNEANQKNPAFREISGLKAAAQTQKKTLEAHLSDLLGITPDILEAIWFWHTPDLVISKVLDDLMQSLNKLPDISDKNPESLVAVLQWIESPGVRDLLEPLNRCGTVVKALKLSKAEINTFLHNADCLEKGHQFALSFDTFTHLAKYKYLQNSLHDTNHVLLNYFVAADSANDVELCKLGNWHCGDLGKLRTKFGLTRVPSTATDAAQKATAPSLNVNDLVTIKNCFDLVQNLKLGVDDVLKLATFDIGNSTSASQPNSPGYEDYLVSADILLSAIKAKYKDDDWDTVHKPIELELLTRKRDALLPYVMLTLQSQGIPVYTPKNLYEYLLIDVEVSGAFTTSVVKEALGCLQLYIYRCRMQMEPGVVLTENLEKYWKWIKSYRVWEANRKVFLYPENYTEPELRKEKSPLFTKLSQDLQQGHLDDETVDKAVRNYLDDFAKIGNLKIAGSCVSTKNDPVHPDQPVKTLHLIGRTHAEPYRYYSRSAVFKYQSHGKKYVVDQWNPWDDIKLNIHSRLVTPVFAFGKLFVFWAEIKPAKSLPTKITANEDVASVAKSSRSKAKQFDAHLKYAFQEFSDKWTSPQSLDNPVHLPPTFKKLSDTYEDVIQRVCAVSYLDKIHVVYPGNDPTRDPKTQPDLDGWNGITTYLDCNLNDEKDRTVTWPMSNLVSYKDKAGKNRIKSHDITASNASFFVAQIGTAEKTGKGLNCTPFSDKSYPYVELTCAGKTTIDAFGYSADLVAAAQSATATRFKTNVIIQQITDGKPTKININTIEIDLVGGHNEMKVSIGQTLGKGTYRICLIPASDPGQCNFLLRTILIDVQKTVLFNAQDNDVLLVASKDFAISPAKTYPVAKAPDWSIIDNRQTEYLRLPAKDGSGKYRYIRLGTGAINTLSQDLFAGGIEGLLTLEAQKTKEQDFHKLLAAGAKTVAGPYPKPSIDFENDANSLYFRELFFHMPYLIANNLTTAQQFELAQKWYHYIFDPTRASEKGDKHHNDRYWRYMGLRSDNNKLLSSEHQSPVKELVSELGNQQQISRYYDDPFDAHAIAAIRPIAYQKTIVMHYIDNLIKWGDKLYRQDTRETLVEAELLYILAYDLLGKQPKDVGTCALPNPQRLGELLKPYKSHNPNKPDDIPEFLVGLEQSLVIDPRIDAPDNPNNEIPGNYFGIPENDKFTGYWDTVKARLYNLRHYLTIDGKAQHLALFQPPIDPMQLVAAIASGIGVAGAIAGLSAPVPYYRFADLLEKAKQVVQTTISFGSALQAALEKNDAEQLSLLRSTHEQSLLKLDVASKTDQLKVEKSTLTNLQARLASSKKRQAHYNSLIEKGLLPKEKLQHTRDSDAITYNTVAQGIKEVAIAAYLIPTVFGFSDGDFKPGEAANQGSSISEGQGGIHSQRGQMNATSAQNERRLEDWQFQLENAIAEVEQIEEQISSATLQVKIAQAQIDHLNKTISQGAEVELFLKSKFSKQELYQWMVGRLSGLYFQMYQLAYSAASSAQTAWQYERAEKTTFVHPGAWDDLHKGLLAGQTLMLDLHRMEQAYLNQDKRRFEIIKTFSVKELYDKKASATRGKSKFEADKDSGLLKFAFTKKDFDNDYPLHTSKTRQIKSVSVSMPALLGPYQNIHATLTQTSSSLVVEGKNQASRRVGEQVALSHGVNDAGVFELNYNDHRYLPFEGTGVESEWELSIPNDNKTQNPGVSDNLTDVIIELRYTVLQ